MACKCPRTVQVVVVGPGLGLWGPSCATDPALTLASPAGDTGSDTPLTRRPSPREVPPAPEKRPRAPPQAPPKDAGRAPLGGPRHRHPRLPFCVGCGAPRAAEPC